MEIKEMTLNEILDSILKDKLEMEEFNKQFETFCYEKAMEMLTGKKELLKEKDVKWW